MSKKPRESRYCFTLGDEESKVCCVCHHEQMACFFYKDKSFKDGRSPRCVGCEKERKGSRRARARERRHAVRVYYGIDFAVLRDLMGNRVGYMPTQGVGNLLVWNMYPDDKDVNTHAYVAMLTTGELASSFWHFPPADNTVPGPKIAHYRED